MGVLALLVNQQVATDELLESVVAGHGDRFDKLVSWRSNYRQLLTVWHSVCRDEGPEFVCLSPLSPPPKPAPRAGKRKRHETA